jgi:hypothetical protein
MANWPARRPRPHSHGAVLEPLGRKESSTRYRLLTDRINELEAELAMVQKETLELQEANTKVRQQEMAAVEGVMVYEKAMGSAGMELLNHDEELSELYELCASAERAASQAATTSPSAVVAAPVAPPAVAAAAAAVAAAQSEADEDEEDGAWVVGPNGVRVPVTQVVLGPSRCLLTLGLEGDEHGLTPLTALFVMAQRLTAQHGSSLKRPSSARCVRGLPWSV